ncbi:MAG: transcription elongation factor GreA [Ruminococcaceae bacterium]|nr:transcription elongation factor GreA [Oscillospiraceae bacterium]
MAEEKIVLTADGLKEIQEELERHKTEGRKDIAEKIKVALSFGDLSENAEYDEAKYEQGKLESRINELEAILQNYELIDEKKIKKDIVNRASLVTIEDIETKKRLTYQIVGPQQANPLKGRISDESPVGKALLDRKKGETIIVDTPAGKLKYKIIDIDKKKKK